jgi:hypothetical protein
MCNFSQCPSLARVEREGGLWNAIEERENQNEDVSDQCRSYLRSHSQVPLSYALLSVHETSIMPHDTRTYVRR